MIDVPATVALVDDSPDMRVLFGAQLTDDRWDLVVAASLEEVLEPLLLGEIDVLLLDRNLAGVDAVERLPDLLSAVVSDIPPAVIVLTAHVAAEDRLSGLEAGAVDYVGKDIPIPELQARVAAQLTRVRHLREHLRRRTQDAHSLVEATIELSRQRTTIDIARTLTARLATIPGADVALLVGLRGAAPGVLASAASGGALPVPITGPLPEAVLEGLALSSGSGPWLTHHITPALSSLTDMPAQLVAGAPIAVDGEVHAVLLALATSPVVSGIRLLSAATTLARVASEAFVRLAMIEARGHVPDVGLEDALKGIGIVPVFHEVRSVGSGRTEGYEGLTRFADGAMPEPRFRAALRQGRAADLELEALAVQVAAAEVLPADRWLAVNLSASTLAAPRLAEILAGTRREVVIELTEHEPISDYEEIRRVAARLPGTPRLAVDDAGSGYACLAHVFSLRPDFVKLDRVWVSDLEHDPARRALIAGITGFADEIGSRVIAEGVEVPGQVDHLRTLGVDLVQGHLYGQPFTVSPGPSPARCP